jgi:glycosyltransferase involved in cell wall biosynthesis
MQKQPLITVGMPIYNAGAYLRDAVQSILDQTYVNWQLLIIDDGSTDNALETIADIRDDRIRIFRDGQNKGLAARLNEAIDMAEGEFFARMDQDDVSLPERFERQVQELLTYPELDLVSVRAETISESGKVVGMLPFEATHERICAYPWRGFYMPHPTWMGRTAWFRKYYYKVPQSYYADDFELLLRAYRTSCFASIPKVLFRYRVRQRINWKHMFRARKSILKVQLKHFIADEQYFNALLAGVVFVIRVATDSAKFLAQCFLRQGRESRQK